MTSGSWPTVDACQNLEPAASLFVVIKSLPKDSLVEKQVILHTGRYIHMDEDDVEETRHRGPVFTKGQLFRF